MTARQAKVLKRNLWGYAFIFPQLLGAIIFALAPVVCMIVISFMEWNVIGSPTFVGFQNFVSQIQHPLVHISLGNNLYYALLTIPVGIALALLLAVLLNNARCKVLFRTVYFMPVVTNSVAVSMIWLWLYNADFGLINQLLQMIGLPKVAWLGDKNIAMPAIAVISIWRNLGYNMVLCLAGLQAISDVYYEAATIDGANGRQKFFNITVPLITPTLFFITITSFIGSFHLFDEIFNITKGGPLKATYSIVYYIYERAFKSLEMGAASAVSALLLILIMLITIVQLTISNRWVYYDE